MKKMVSRLLALALMGSLVLSGCGSADVGTSNNATDTNSEKAESETGTETETGEENSANEIKDLVIPIQQLKLLKQTKKYYIFVSRVRKIVKKVTYFKH